MKTLKFAFKIFLFLLVFVVVILSIVRSSNQICEEISVTFHYSGDTTSIDENYIIELLSSSNIGVLGLKSKEIDQEGISHLLSECIFVKSVQKIRIAGSTLQVDLELSRPEIAIMDGEVVRLYIDEEGACLPYDSRFEVPAYSARGYYPIKTAYDTTAIARTITEELHSIVTVLQDDTTFSSFNTIHRNRRAEYTLLPSNRGMRLMIGSVANFKAKLPSLSCFYNQILPQYHTTIAALDLRFEKRIFVRNQRK